MLCSKQNQKWSLPQGGQILTALVSKREFPFTACKDTWMCLGFYVQTSFVSFCHLMVSYHHLHSSKKLVYFKYVWCFLFRNTCAVVAYFSHSVFFRCDSLKIFFLTLMVILKSLTLVCVKKTSRMEQQPRLSVAPLNTLPLRSVNNWLEI